MNIRHMARLTIAHAHLDTPDLRPAQRIAEHSGSWDGLDRYQWLSEEEELNQVITCAVNMIREERNENRTD